MVLSFQEFRNVKDNLPNGSMNEIAKQLDLEVETVRNYFGGTHFEDGRTSDVHFEKGVNGGYVRIENDRIFNCALDILNRSEVLA